ncbi:MAG: hypothetical protein OJI67_15975 [Prosthecobacter sp.]|nr:hypothetical protein [Prosthecobacter sp.]
MKDSDDKEIGQSEERRKARAKRQRFLGWCKERGEDPEDEGAFDRFNEIVSFWDDLNEDDSAGWNDNMNKD